MSNLQDIANQLNAHRQSRRDKEELKFLRERHNEFLSSIIEELSGDLDE